MFLGLALGLVALAQQTSEESRFRALVDGYYARILHQRANPRIHAIKMVGSREVKGKPATMVCVSYTMRLRFGGDHDMIEALFFSHAEVVRRAGGTEAMALCSVV